LVQFQILVCHAVDREARRYRRPTGSAIEVADAADRSHGFIDVVDR
jgi:hypothetical protein